MPCNCQRNTQKPNPGTIGADECGAIEYCWTPGTHIQKYADKCGNEVCLHKKDLKIAKLLRLDEGKDAFWAKIPDEDVDGARGYVEKDPSGCRPTKFKGVLVRCPDKCISPICVAGWP